VQPATRVIYKLASSYCSKLTLVLLITTALSGADTAEAAFQRAVSALSSQDYKTAEKEFQLVLKLEPGNVGALGNLGVVYSKTQLYDKAIGVYQRALKVAPGDKALSTNLGLAYLKQERFTAALPLFVRLSQDPTNLQARELVATCHLSLFQNQEALAEVSSLLEAEPDNAGLLYMKGVALSRLKKISESQQAFTRMMAATNPAQANFLMGKASYETEGFDQAADFFRKVIAADPAFEGAHRELGKTLVSLRDDDNAEKELRLAGTNDSEAVYFLGALLSQRHPAEAITLLNKSKELAPDFWGPFYYLGRIAVEQGRAKEAVGYLERAAALNPEESAVQYQLGRAFQKTGREAEARTAFARVKELKEKSLRKELNILSPSSQDKAK
jgi:tetratricopeptide (TPR) repeat protein